MDFIELFAGIGLFRRGLEQAGGHWNCLLANDIDASKCAIYRAQYGAHDLIEGDIAALTAEDVQGHPDLMTGSFPCQDLSLAGNRAGLAGERSGQAHQFFRLLEDLALEGRAPHTIILENVVGLLTSHQGADIRTLLELINHHGYAADLLVLDAVHWLPQSRSRVFVIGRHLPVEHTFEEPAAHAARPPAVTRVIHANADLRWSFLSLPALPTQRAVSLADLIDQDAGGWLQGQVLERELGYIANSANSQARVIAAQERIAQEGGVRYLTGYRRTRNGVTNLELRGDGVAGCLRTANGGSSRQLLIKVDAAGIHIRFMTPLEYARLMGVETGDWVWAEQPNNKHLTGFGDAVAVPVITWLAQALVAQNL